MANRKSEIEIQNEEKAYDLMDQAMEVESDEEAKQLIEQAIQLKPDFLDAKIELILFIEDNFERIKELEKLEKEEKEKLIKEGYFDKENIPHFYDILETRPYIRLLANIAMSYQLIGSYRKAMELYETMITLNENDNLGVRYSLMGIYALLEENDKMKQLVKKYPEDSVPFHLFQFASNFKSLDLKNARNHIKVLQQLVPKFRLLLTGGLEESDFIDHMDDFYQTDTIEEVLLYMEEFEKLFTNAEMLEWAVSVLDEC